MCLYAYNFKAILISLVKQRQNLEWRAEPAKRIVY
jgi:hypothetical protein